MKTKQPQATITIPLESYNRLLELLGLVSECLLQEITPDTADFWKDQPAAGSGGTE